MELDDTVHVNRGHDIAVENHERVIDALSSKPNRPTGSKRSRFHDISDAHTGATAVAEDFFDSARLVVEAENDFVNVGHLLQQIDLVMKKGAIEDRNNGLGRMDRQRPQPRALTPCKEEVNETVCRIVRSFRRRVAGRLRRRGRRQRPLLRQRARGHPADRQLSLRLRPRLGNDLSCGIGSADRLTRRCF